MTVGAIAAVVLAAANVIAMIAGWNSLGGDIDEGRAAAFTILWSLILLVVAWGMWRSRYWAVLGMQTLLGITLDARLAVAHHREQHRLGPDPRGHPRRRRERSSGSWSRPWRASRCPSGRPARVR